MTRFWTLVTGATACMSLAWITHSWIWFTAFVCFTTAAALTDTGSGDDH